MPDYTIQQGDCVSQVALRFGLSSATIWNHPKNQALKQSRKDLNVLLPGDVLFIPELTMKLLTRAVDAKYKFVRKGTPAKIRLRLMDADDRPQANLPYKLVIDGILMKPGSTDGQGWLEQVIPPDAVQGVLELHDGAERFTLQLGYLDPVETVSGVQARLANMGYYLGPRDGQLNALLQEAITQFQQDAGIAKTGLPDAATQAALKKQFGS